MPRGRAGNPGGPAQQQPAAVAQPEGGRRVLGGAAVLEMEWGEDWPAWCLPVPWLGLAGSFLLALKGAEQLPQLCFPIVDAT